VGFQEEGAILYTLGKGEELLSQFLPCL